MFAPGTRSSVWLIDRLLDAGELTRAVRRKLRTVATASVTTEDVDKGHLRSEIVNFGSSWAALCLALQIRPVDLDELLKDVGVYKLPKRSKLRAFDACVDGYTVFHDARLRRKI